MKSLIIILLVMIFFTTNGYSARDCKNIKKTSPKYLLCKTGSGFTSIKNKFSKKREAKKKSGKKSIFTKFGEAKTLNDLTK